MKTFSLMGRDMCEVVLHEKEEKNLQQAKKKLYFTFQVL